MNAIEEFNNKLKADKEAQKKEEEARKQLERDKYCCKERARLYVDNRYALLHIDYDHDYITLFGTFESENYDEPGFQMNYCMFCGAKLLMLEHRCDDAIPCEIYYNEIIGRWYLERNDDSVYIIYCPYCGAKL